MKPRTAYVTVPTDDEDTDEPLNAHLRGTRVPSPSRLLLPPVCGDTPTGIVDDLKVVAPNVEVLATLVVHGLEASEVSVLAQLFVHPLQERQIGHIAGPQALFILPVRLKAFNHPHVTPRDASMYKEPAPHRTWCDGTFLPRTHEKVDIADAINRYK